GSQSAIAEQSCDTRHVKNTPQAPRLLLPQTGAQSHRTHPCNRYSREIARAANNHQPRNEEPVAPNSSRAPQRRQLKTVASCGRPNGEGAQLPPRPRPGPLPQSESSRAVQHSKVLKEPHQ